MENQRLSESEFKGKLSALYDATCDFFSTQDCELAFIVICTLRKVMQAAGFKDDYSIAIDKFEVLIQEHLANFKN